MIAECLPFEQLTVDVQSRTTDRLAFISLPVMLPTACHIVGIAFVIRLRQNGRLELLLGALGLAYAI